MRIGWVCLFYLWGSFYSFHFSTILSSMTWPRRHGYILNPNLSLLHQYHPLNMDCFIRNLLISILRLWERQLSFHSSPWSTRGGLSPFLHPTPVFRKSISENGIVNGKDALLSPRPHGTLVDVSDREGSHFTLLEDFFSKNSWLPFLSYSMEGVWEGFFTVCLCPF